MYQQQPHFASRRPTDIFKCSTSLCCSKKQFPWLPTAPREYQSSYLAALAQNLVEAHSNLQLLWESDIMHLLSLWPYTTKVCHIIFTWLILWKLWVGLLFVLTLSFAYQGSSICYSLSYWYIKQLFVGLSCRALRMLDKHMCKFDQYPEMHHMWLHLHLLA